MRLSSGTKLGAYQIIAPLGAGGMGEVYRARDATLKREVAIKVIPDTYASDPERLHRFQLEAEAAASLNHPNIVTIHHVGRDSGTSYIVAELLQGETLRERLRSGPIPMRVATDFGAQITRGLAAAHERGIVHRDLKPENIFVTRDGRIKILDFGLAKLTDRPSDLERGRNDSEPTATHVTEPGMAVGTAAYMSPEQVRGRQVDFHADIFALGAVLYEMLTGKQAFSRPTAAETMTAILNEDPPSLSQSGKNVSPGLQRVILRCLEKKPEQRFQSASDLAFALEALSDPSDSGAVAIAPKRRSPWPWILAAACALAVIAAVVLWLRLPPPVPFVESITQITDDGEPKSVAVNDGSRVYFQEGTQGAIRVAQVSISGGRTAPIENAPLNSSIVNVAPDGSEMLLRAENGDILALPLPAGEPRKLLDGKSYYDADLLPDGSIVYSAPGQQGGSDLVLAEKDGSNPRKILSSPNRLYGILASPDGANIFLCEAHKDGCTVQSIRKDGSGRRTDLLEIRDGDGTWYAVSHDQRYLLYTRSIGNQSDLWAVPLKKGLLQRTSGPVRLTAGPLSYSGVFPSRDGRQLFTVGTKSREEMVRYDPRTRQFSPYFPGLAAIEAQFSPDGEWMTYLSFPDTSLFRCRIDGSERKQLTFPPMKAGWPRFTPDGKKVSFTSVDQSIWNTDSAIYMVDMAGGQPRRIAEARAAAEWSPDGGSLVFVGGPNQTSPRIRLMNLATGRISDLPGSESIAGAIFINAGTLVAFNVKTNKFVTFDFASGKWSDLVALPSMSLSWGFSRDHKFLFYAVGAQKVQRVSLATRKVEDVTELKGFHQAYHPTSGNWDFSLAPDGSLIFPRDISFQEIYALNMRWP
jgi:serine/threonine protein kinase